MKKETSVEWYAQKDTELTIQFLEGKLNQIQLAVKKLQCLNDAKQMHKEELRNECIGLLKWMNKVAETNPIQLETDFDDIVEMYLKGGNNE